MTVLVQSTPLLLEVAPEIDEFLQGAGRRGVGLVKVRTEWGKFAASVAHPEAKRFSASGWLRPLTRGSVPGPRWWLRPQTPVMGLRSRARHARAQAPQTWYSGLAPASGAWPPGPLPDGLDTPCKILYPPLLLLPVAMPGSRAIKTEDYRCVIHKFRLAVFFWILRTFSEKIYIFTIKFKSWASTHRGKWKNDPLENGWKIKKRKHAKKSNFVCLCYSLRAIRAALR